LLNIKDMLISNHSLLLSSMGILKFSKCKEQFIFETLSFKLNIRFYNRLDKEVIDFKEPKSGPVVLYTTKYFHHQDGEDADKDRKCKTHI